MLTTEETERRHLLGLCDPDECPHCTPIILDDIIPDFCERHMHSDPCPHCADTKIKRCTDCGVAGHTCCFFHDGNKQWLCPDCMDLGVDAREHADLKDWALDAATLC